MVRHTFKVLRCATLAIGLMAIGYSQAQEYWIGNPTPGDYFRKNLADAVVAAGKLNRAAPQLTYQIEEARGKFFSEGQTPQQKKQSGEEFSRLLFSKDMIYASMFMSEGFTQHSIAALRTMEAIATRGDTGQKNLVDTGIPRSATPEFQRWVRSVRASLGGNGDGQVLLFDQQQLSKALLANIDSYAGYREARDKAEHDAWNKQVATGVRAENDAGNRLADTKIGVLENGSDKNSKLWLWNGGATGFPEDKALLRLQTELMESKSQKMILCLYGKAKDKLGYAITPTYIFWYQRAPANIAQFKAADPEGKFRDYGTKGVSACPATTGEATATYHRNNADWGFPWKE